MIACVGIGTSYPAESEVKGPTAIMFRPNYFCPQCRAQVTWQASAAADTGAAVDATYEGVLVERKHVQLAVKLLLQPDKVTGVLNSYLFPPDPNVTLLEAVAQIPLTMGEAAGDVVAGVVRLRVPDGDCDLCSELFGALVGLLVALLLEPIVEPIVVFLEVVSAFSALLPGGDVEPIARHDSKDQIKDLIGSALDGHLENWKGLVRLSAAVWLAVEHQGVSRSTQQPAGPSDTAWMAFLSTVSDEDLSEPIHPHLTPMDNDGDPARRSNDRLPGPGERSLSI